MAPKSGRLLEGAVPPCRNIGGADPCGVAKRFDARIVLRLAAFDYAQPFSQYLARVLIATGTYQSLDKVRLMVG